MKVLMINGSPRAKGNTAIALAEMEKIFVSEGVKVETVRIYKVRGTLPPPDTYVGQSPLWKTATIDAWQAARPGQDWRKGRRT